MFVIVDYFCGLVTLILLFVAIVQCACFGWLLLVWHICLVVGLLVVCFAWLLLLVDSYGLLMVWLYVWLFGWFGVCVACWLVWV